MAAVKVYNLPEETHWALRGRGTESEIQDILETAVRPAGQVKLGALLVEIGREAGLSDDDVDALQRLRDKCPASPLTFE